MLYAGSYCSLLRIRSGNSIFVIQIMFGPCRDYFWSLFSLLVTSMDQFWRAAWDSIFRLVATETWRDTEHRSAETHQSHLHEIFTVYSPTRVKFDWGPCHVSARVTQGHVTCHAAGDRVCSLDGVPSNNWVSSAGDLSHLRWAERYKVTTSSEKC